MPPEVFERLHDFVKGLPLGIRTVRRIKPPMETPATVQSEQGRAEIKMAWKLVFLILITLLGGQTPGWRPLCGSHCVYHRRGLAALSSDLAHG